MTQEIMRIYAAADDSTRRFLKKLVAEIAAGHSFEEALEAAKRV